MFSFPDARKVHNRLQWIGKTRKMAGTSGNSFYGSYRVHIDYKANSYDHPFRHCSVGFVSDVYVAVYAYTSSEQGDLAFSQGEYISVLTRDGDWWTGSIGDRTGIFPANYVKKAETAPAQVRRVSVALCVLYESVSVNDLFCLLVTYFACFVSQTHSAHFFVSSCFVR